MSSPYAIAAVTATLTRVLHEGLIAFKVADIVGGNVTVSALPPDKVVLPPANEATNQLNLFLYQATRNQGWASVGYPSRDARGERIGNPPLALDLHFLLTAYGIQPFFSEIVLGHAMHLLHESPVLTRDAIRKALKAVTPPKLSTALAGSDLADQVEQIKITPVPMSTEEISRLWTAFQASYRATAAYLATVVLIESRRPARPSLPVRQRLLTVLTLEQPAIEKVVAEAGENEPIEAGKAFLIHGQNLKRASTQVWIGDVVVTAAATEILPERIRVALPAALPAGLTAGVQAVRIVQPVDLGDPAVPHRGFESNAGPFALRPQVKDAQVDAPNKEVVVKLHPKVKRSQRVELLLNRLDPPANTPPNGYSLVAKPLDPAVAEEETVRFPYSGVEAGKYLVRARVDGAESWPEMVAGEFAKPEVTFP